MTQKFNYVEHYKVDAEEFDYFEERKGATEHDERRVHEYILSKIPNGTKNILDVGSGSAWVAQHFIKSGIKVTSLDISQVNVQKAIQKVKGNFHSALVADSFYLPFKNDSFDIIIASEIIEHVLKPKDFISELYRVLAANGKLIITTPYKEKLRYYLCIHCNKKTPVHSHIHSFDENVLNSISPKNAEITWETFGNKLLIFLRTYVILKYFPFVIWKLIDTIFNSIKNIPVHIIVEYKKQSLYKS